MARYGREFRRRMEGGRGWGAEQRGRGWEYGEGPGYGWGGEERGRYRGYGPEPGYGWRGRGGGQGWEYGEATGYEGPWGGYGGYGYPRGYYDIEYGGRGMPPGERFGGYDWEMERPEGFGMGYGFEYIRSGPPGYRRARPRMRTRMRGGYGREFGGREFGGREFGGREPERRGPGGGYYERGGRFGERGYESAAGRRGGGMRRGEEFPEERWPTGHSAADRWPEEGHDLDHLSSRERRMSDRDVEEAVRENLFQDTWIDPERIRVDVEDGVVTLTGEVRDFMEARYAWDDAWESAGVRGVINNLTIRADIPQEGMDMPQTSGPKYRSEERR